MAKNKYPDGYRPKILYWADIMDKAVRAGDMPKALYAEEKLDYFVDKKADLDADERLDNIDPAGGGGLHSHV